MRERPIAYTAENILAILARRKTMTRRIVAGAKEGAWMPKGAWIELQGDRWVAGCSGQTWAVTPPWQLGDSLWLREAWRTGIDLDPFNARMIAKRCAEAGWPKPWAPVRYEADGATDNWDTIESFGAKPGRLRAARFMPYWAHRIDQRVVSLRVERLQAITLADIEAEGVVVPPCDYTVPERPDVLEWERVCWARRQFEALWDGINGGTDYCAWRHDPFVWVVGTDTLGA